MVKVNFKQIDLLRNRRESNYLADPYFIDTNKYIKNTIEKCPEHNKSLHPPFNNLI